MAKNTSYPPIKDGVKADNSTYSSNQIDRMISEVESEIPVLPDVSGEDEGKVLTVGSDGSWEAAEVPSVGIDDTTISIDSTWSSSKIDERIEEVMNNTIRFPDSLIADQNIYFSFSKAINTMETKVKVADIFTATEKCKFQFSPGSKIYCNVSSDDASVYIYKNNTKLGGFDNITSSTYVNLAPDVPIVIDLEAGDVISIWGKVDNIGSHTGSANIRLISMFGATYQV